MGMLLHRQGEKRKKLEQSPCPTNQREYDFPPNIKPAEQEISKPESEKPAEQETNNKRTKRETKNKENKEE